MMSERTTMRRRLVIGGALAALSLGMAATGGEPEKAGETGDELVNASVAREDAVEMLLEATRDPSAQVRANAIEALEGASGRIGDVALRGLSDPNVGVRTVSAMVIGRARLRDAAPATRALLRESSGYTRAAAIFALRRCGFDEDPTPLAWMVSSHPDVRVRAHAAFILGELGDKSAISMLRQATVSPMGRASDAERRLLELQIAEALIKLGDEQELQTVRAAMFPSRPDQLEATALAVQILGEVRDRGSIDQLIYLSAYEGRGSQRMPAEVRLAVADALAKMGKTEGTFIADEYAGHEIDAVRAQAAAVYGRVGRAENLDPLRRMMKDPSRLVQIAAAGGVLELTTQTAERHALVPGSGG